MRSIGHVECEFFLLLQSLAPLPGNALSAIRISRAVMNPFLRRDLAVKVHRLELLEDPAAHFFLSVALRFFNGRQSAAERFSLSRALVCTRIVLYFAGCVGAGALSSFAAHALAFVRVLHARRRVKIAFSFLTSSLTLLVLEKDVFK